MALGKCREMPPDTFFPSDGVGVEIARRICVDCPVKGPCLEYAMENHIDHGVWGARPSESAAGSHVAGASRPHSPPTDRLFLLARRESRPAVLECVVNVSEGRDAKTIAAMSDAVGRSLLDVHSDPFHHRSVLTFAGPPDVVVAAARRLGLAAVDLLDLRRHSGVHPRLGVLDVVPFVPYGGGTMADAIGERDSYAAWLGNEIGVPCFCYGPERSLPEVRRRAFVDLEPDYGPLEPHPTAGATCVGARGCSSPTTCSWPTRSRWPRASQGSCAGPRCGRSASRWEISPRCPATS